MCAALLLSNIASVHPAQGDTIGTSHASTDLGVERSTPSKVHVLEMKALIRFRLNTRVPGGIRGIPKPVFGSQRAAAG